MVGTPRALGLVAITTSLGVALFAACGGPTRSSEPPMAGSAAILPSPVNAEIVPKSTPSAEPSTKPQVPNQPAEADPGQGPKTPAEIVVPPVASASASTAKPSPSTTAKPGGKK